MKLFSLRLTTLKSKLYAIVFASFVVRVVAFFALPNSGWNLIPDEGSYARLTEMIGFELSRDELLYRSSRALIEPSSWLNNIGLNGLDSVRLTSSFYSLLTLILVAQSILKIGKVNEYIAENLVRFEWVVLSLFAVFSFIPSRMIWSVVGLRESALEFWTLASFCLVFYIFELKQKLSIPIGLLFITLILGVFYSRPKIGWILVFILILYFFLRIKNTLAQILIPVTLLALFIGYSTTTGASTHPDSEYVLKNKNNLKPASLAELELLPNSKCNYAGQEINLNGNEFVCSKSPNKLNSSSFRNPLPALITQTQNIEEYHSVNQVGAASSISLISCPNKGESISGKYFCTLYRMPFTTFTFLFRPLLGADVTSTSSLFAAIENVFWLGALLFVLVMLIRNRRLAFFGALAPSLLFFSIYSVVAGAYEGNMGTAFRHKSLILWVVILLLASTIVATQQRKAEQQGISGSSQE